MRRTPILTIPSMAVLVALAMILGCQTPPSPTPDTPAPSASEPAPPQEPRPVEAPAAVVEGVASVNGVTITEAVYELAWGKTQSPKQGGFTLPSLEPLGEQRQRVLDRIIDETLMQQAIDATDIKVSEAAIEAWIKRESALPRLSKPSEAELRATALEMLQIQALVAREWGEFKISEAELKRVWILERRRFLARGKGPLQRLTVPFEEVRANLAASEERRWFSDSRDALRARLRAEATIIQHVHFDDTAEPADMISDGSPSPPTGLRKGPSSNPSNARLAAPRIQSLDDGAVAVMAPPTFSPQDVQDCKGGDADACVTLSMVYRLAVGVPRSFRKVETYLDQACALGHMRACADLGLFVLNGRGVKMDYKRSAALFEMACEGGEHAGCLGLADLYERGLGVAEDSDKSASIEARSCGAGYAMACYLQSINQEVRYKKMDRANALILKAAALFDADCMAGDAEACNELSDIFFFGKFDQPTAESQDIALGLRNRACVLGSGNGCLKQGWQLVKVKVDQREAAAVFERGCELGNPVACMHAGASREAGLGVSADPVAAEKLYEAGCGLYYGASCVRHADLYLEGVGVSPNRGRAKAILKEACDRGVGVACKASERLVGKVR